MQINVTPISNMKLQESAEPGFKKSTIIPQTQVVKYIVLWVSQIAM